MQAFFLILSLVMLVLAAVASMMFRSMLKSAISLAAASAFLAVTLFLMGAYWAALVELSVCAGLITVIFVSAISMTTKNRRDAEHRSDHHGRFIALPFILIFLGLGLIAILVLGGFNMPFQVGLPASFDSFKEVFWNTRQVDILGQIIVLLAGAFAVVVLFKERDKQ